MENWKEITKNVTVYQTMVNWFKRDRAKANPTAFGFKGDWKQSIESAKQRIKREGTIQPGDLTKGL